MCDIKIQRNIPISYIFVLTDIDLCMLINIYFYHALVKILIFVDSYNFLFHCAFFSMYMKGCVDYISEFLLGPFSKVCILQKILSMCCGFS